jgi:hypothetical protein
MQSPARSYLMASVAAVGSSAIAIAPSVAPPPDVRIQADPHPAARVVSKATVELLAALQPMSPRSVLSLASRQYRSQRRSPPHRWRRRRLR